MSIGIELAGKDDNLPAVALIRSLAHFLELVREVDSTVSGRVSGSIRWEVVSLGKSSPAVLEIGGKSRLRAGDYTSTVQYSVVNGVYELSQQPEQPENYSYSALTTLSKIMRDVRTLPEVRVFSGAQKASLNRTVRNNVDNLIGVGSVSLGSVRGTLDAVTVHSGHEFRIWPTRKPRPKPIACRFKKADLGNVLRHVKSEVEVFGAIRRNNKGLPVFVKVESFNPISAPSLPSI